MTRERKLEQGLVQVYTGDGKGKTTAALGLCFRALGRGFQVVMVQFMKGRNATGELLSRELFGEQFALEQYGSGRFNKGRPPTEQELQLAHAGVQRAKAALEHGDVDLVVLDEISHAVNHKLVDVLEIRDLIVTRAPGVEVVLTGRNMPEELLDIADLISSIEELRHPCEQGIPAREGIEY